MFVQLVSACFYNIPVQNYFLQFVCCKSNLLPTYEYDVW